MNKKTFIQFVLIGIIIIILLYVNKIYLNLNKVESQNQSKLVGEEKINEQIILNKKNQNFIKDIKYNSNNNNGDRYVLTANFGEINLDNPDLIYLHNVEGTVTLKDNQKIIITSGFANFNSKTFETIFIDSVKIVRQDEIITGDELHLILEASVEELIENPNKEQNLIRMKNNIFYKKTGLNIKTDIVEFDLITKNLKIYMNDKKKKVIVNKIN